MSFLLSMKEIFFVSLKIGGGNQMMVSRFFQGVKMGDCVKLSRHIEGNLDREEEDFALQIASAGLGEHSKFLSNAKKMLAEG